MVNTHSEKDNNKCLGAYGHYNIKEARKTYHKYKY